MVGRSGSLESGGPEKRLLQQLSGAVIRAWLVKQSLGRSQRAVKKVTRGEKQQSNERQGCVLRSDSTFSEPNTRRLTHTCVYRTIEA